MAPRSEGAPGLIHALTVDVEDYFQVSAFEGVVPRERWSHFESRVEQNTDRLLALFAERGVLATFFTLGWVAERFPNIVRRIAAAGHEVACHGYSHRLVFDQSPAEFADETRRSKGLIEDQAQCPVTAYRAASYSVTTRSLWALRILAEEGFQLDSSIFPIRHDRYGIPDAPRHIHRIELDHGQSLIEFPLSSLNVLGANVPVAGGGYFRLYPYALTRLLLDWLVRQQHQPFVFYLHPWEIDPKQPRIENAGALSRFRHYLNLEYCEQRLRALLTHFNFGTMQAAVASVRDIPSHRYHS